MSFCQICKYWQVFLMNEKNKNKSKKGKIDKPQKKFPVVGIGASAGGFDALKKFFTAMPPEPDMVFVLVQHLDPTHESSMADIMGRYSQLKVLQAKDGVKLAPNHLYIIPPNRDMGMMNDVIQLLKPSEPHGFRLPINFFLNNLASPNLSKR